MPKGSSNNKVRRNPYPQWAVFDSLSSVHGRVEALDYQSALRLSRLVYPDVPDLVVMQLRAAPPQLREIARACPLITPESVARSGLGLPLDEWTHELRRRFPKTSAGGAA